MKKIITIAIGLLCLNTLFAHTQQPTLFVQQAKSALFTPATNQCYTLTLIEPKNKVLYFASAPNTNVGFTDSKEFFYAWKKQGTSLNGAFVATSNDGTEYDYAFKISNPAINKDTKRIEYTVCPLKNKSLNPMTTQVFNNTSVFIDPISHWPP